MRYHFMDRLRVLMMLLGIVLHASLAYTTLPLEFWPYRDAASSRVLDVVAIFVHVFRMPLFLVVAGFFAHQLLARYGVRGFARNRLARVAVPLVLGWIVLFPMFAAVSASAADGGRRLDGVLRFLRSGQLWPQPTWIHLWFLYYLLLLYALTLLLRAVGPQLRLAGAWDWLQRQALAPNRGLLLFAGAGTLIALSMRNGGLDPPDRLRPQLHILIACGSYYLFGWLLYAQRTVLAQLQPAAGLRVAAAMVLLLVFLGLHRFGGEAADWQHGALHALAAAVWTLVCWLMIYGLLGLFSRYGDAPGERWRALSESAYWVYLAHLPLVLWLCVLLGNVALPAPLKLVVVTLSAYALLWLAWIGFVRDGWLGALLEGRLLDRFFNPARPARDG